MAVCLGLIMGGALGNAIDRVILGGVADFFSLHAFGFYWYVFNLADVGIVAGVAGLLYELVPDESQRRRKAIVAQCVRQVPPRGEKRTKQRLGDAMASKARLPRGVVLAIPLCLAFAAGGCSMDDVQFNGGLFDMAGLSDSAKAKLKSGDPKVAERAPLVVPPSLERLPPPGEPRSSPGPAARSHPGSRCRQEGIKGRAGAQAGRVLQGQLRAGDGTRRRDDRARRRGAAGPVPAVGDELHQEMEFERRRVAAEPISTSQRIVFAAA